MPPITALLHTANDALRLGRTLEMLLPCPEIVIVDHHSVDATRRIAREHGARIVTARSDYLPDYYLKLASHNWILCMVPGESITESLQATLYEWSVSPRESVDAQLGFSVFVREQTPDERWLGLPAPETRLISRRWNNWRGHLPANDPSATPLEGELLRFALP